MTGIEAAAAINAFRYRHPASPIYLNDALCMAENALIQSHQNYIEKCMDALDDMEIKDILNYIDQCDLCEADEKMVNEWARQRLRDASK